jgi:hypothetical protein
MLHHHGQGPLRSSILIISLFLEIPATAAPPCEPDPAGGAESAVYALRDAFVHQDVDAYGALLADDYVFRFLPRDVDPGQPDTLDRAGELNFARHLFRGGAASHRQPAAEVRLEFVITERSPVVCEDSLRWQQFTVMTHLRVSVLGDGELRVDGPALLRWRRGCAPGSAWRLVEWTDRSGSREGRRGCCLAAAVPEAGARLVRPPSRILR